MITNSMHPHLCIIHTIPLYSQVNYACEDKLQMTLLPLTTVDMELKYQ